MSCSLEESREIKRKFDRLYFYKAPHSHYVSGCALLTIQESQEKGFNVTTTDGESLEDHCLAVTLKPLGKSAPEFPHEYEGLRVFYKVEK